MRKPVFEDVRATEERLAELMAANGSTRSDAVRLIVNGAYRKVLREHPAIDPVLLVVDITDMADGFRAVIHDGCHVPGALSKRWTRRYNLAPWLALGGSFS
jgi:hypothetical protein